MPENRNGRWNGADGEQQTQTECTWEWFVKAIQRRSEVNKIRGKDFLSKVTTNSYYKQCFNNSDLQEWQI